MQQLLGVISTLYAPASSSALKAQADSWLKAFQKTPDAWMTSDQILNLPDTCLEAKIFASQTIRKKVAVDLHDLDNSVRMSLKQSILHLLQNPQIVASRIIVTQLCLALASLACQTELWKQPVADMFTLFSTSSSSLSFVLLEFLIVLPQELDNIGSPDGALTSSQVVEQVLSFAFSMLQSCSDNSSMSCRLLTCVDSWIYYATPQQFQQFPVIPVTFMALASSSDDDDLFDAAADLACDVIFLFRFPPEKANSPESIVKPKFTADNPICMTLMQELYAQLSTLMTLAQKYAQTRDEDAKYKALTRIFVQAGESFMKFIVASPNDLSTVLDALLVCTSFPDLEIVPMTFPFWGDLTSDLLMRYKKSTEQLTFTGVTVPPALLNVYTRLMDIVIGHLRYPPDLSAMTSAERDDFRDLRHVIGDVLKDCCLVIGQRQSLSNAYAMLTGALQKVSGALTNWQEIESILFALRAMGSEISREESEVMPSLMSLLMKLPEHPKIQYAATLVIGRYSDWTNLHADFIPLHLDFISRGFGNDEVVAASAQALKYLCQSCGQKMMPYLGKLHPFYVSVFSTFGRGNMMELSEAIGYVINAVPEEHLAETLGSFCLPVLTQLEASMRTIGEDASKRKVIDMLDIYVVFVKTVHPKSSPSEQATLTVEHPCISVFRKVWPLLEEMLQNVPSAPVHEAACKLLKHAVICYGRHMISILPNVLTTLALSYQKYRHSVILWVSAFVLRGYSSIDTLTLMLSSFFETLIARSFERFTPVFADSDPDSYDDFSRLLSVGFVHVAQVAYRADVIAPTLDFLEMGIGRPNHIIHESALTTLRELLTEAVIKGGDAKAISSKAITEGYGERIAWTIGKGITGINEYGVTFAGAMNQCIANLFIQMGQLTSAEAVNGYMHGALVKLSGDVGGRVAESSLTKFMTCFAESVISGEIGKLRYAIPHLVSAFRARKL